VEVKLKYGVPPASIPDYLALVGDSADGYPGLPGWGAKSAAAVIAHYGSIDAIPASVRDWAVPVRGAARLASSLAADREIALLFRTLARLRTDAPVSATVDALEWRGPKAEFTEWAARMGAPGLAERATALAAGRNGMT
jgi:5'-3' exonuclease